MIKNTLTIQNQRGIHTRAAAKLVDMAKKFESQIELTYRERTVDCKSIMGIITLGAQKDQTIDIAADGPDEKQAVAAIEELFNNKFGED